MSVYTLTARVGNSFRTGIGLSNPAQGGQVAGPRDLTGAVITTMIRSGQSQASDPAPTSEFTIANRRDTAGVFELQLPENHRLAARDYYYEIEVSQNNSNERILGGVLRVDAGFV